MEKTVIKSGDSEIDKRKFHKYKKPISVKNIDINKIVVSNKTSLVKSVSNVLLDKKILKKDLYVYFFQK